MIESALSSLLSTSSLLFWEFLEIVGAAIVIIGVWGEYWAERGKVSDKPNDLMQIEFKRKWLEGLFWRILLSGLAIELVGAIATLTLSNIEIAGLKKQTEQLHNENLVLQAKLQPRRITMEQTLNFIFLTEKIRKIPIIISVYTGSSEAETFASDLRQMFTVAGFQTNSTPNLWGVEQHPDRRFHRPSINDTNEMPAVVFLGYSTNGIVVVHTPTRENTNGFNRPIVRSGNEEDIYFGIDLCLQQIGVKTEWSADPEDIKPGCSEIVVPDK
jgi:hypothetical protein